MDRFPKLLELSAIVAILVGLISLSPSRFAAVFGYQVRDIGLLLAFAATSLSLGVVLLGLYFLVAREVRRTGSTELKEYRGIVPSLVIAFGIGFVYWAWGWARGLYTARTALVPLIIYAIFVWWAWNNRAARYVRP